MNNSLDTPSPANQSTVSFLPTAIRYGLIGGLIVVIYTLLGILTGFSSPSAGGWAMFFNFLISINIYIGTLIYGVRQHRDNELDGLISFGRAFLVGFVIVVIMVMLGKVFSYIYFNYIDTGYLGSLLEDMGEMLEGYGLEGDDYDNQMEKMAESFEQQKNLLGGLSIPFGMGGALSALIALIMKKKLSVD